MVDQALPPWGGDPLLRFLSNAQWNERASAVNVPNPYALLQRVHGAFEQVAAITEALRQRVILLGNSQSHSQTTRPDGHRQGPTGRPSPGEYFWGFVGRALAA
jgi:hypothetical protein